MTACGARQMSTFSGQLFTAMQSVSQSVTARLTLAPHKNADRRGRRGKTTTQQHRCPSCVMQPRCHGPGWGGVFPSLREPRRAAAAGAAEQEEEEEEDEGECQRCVLSRRRSFVSASQPDSSLMHEPSRGLPRGTRKLRPLPCAPAPPRRVALGRNKKINICVLFFVVVVVLSRCCRALFLFLSWKTPLAGRGR